MRKQHLLLTLLSAYSIILFSCQNSSKKSNATYEISLIEAKKIVLPVDENTYYLSKSMFQFEEDDKEYLLFGNLEKHQHELLIYDIEEQNLHKRIPLEKQGPNGVPGIYGSIPFYDSKTVLVSQYNLGRISIIDGEGNVVRKYNMRQATDNNKRRGLWVDSRFGVSFFYTPSFIKDSIVYFSNGIFIRKRLNREDWKTIPMFNSLNLKNGHINTLPINYPDIFEDDVKVPAGGGYEFTYDYNYKQERLVCSFTGYDSIMVTDDLKQVYWRNGKSRYLKSIRPRVYEADGLNWLREATESPSYHNIMYDKYRDVYYRIAELPYEFKQNESLVGTPKAREFSVIIFDKDLNIIGETKFPGNKYFYKMSFVGRDGLYISENNEANPEFDEDKLVFACFKLENLNKKEQ